MPYLSGLWMKLPVLLRAILAGILIALPAANVWPLLLLNLGAPQAAGAEAMFLTLYLCWSAGGGPPRSTQATRATAFRRTTLSSAQWLWGTVAALFFAGTIHASIVLLFRFVPYPVAEFRQGYDFSFIPTVPLRWLAVVVSAASAGICEETGFRGYMQRPIELRYGARRDFTRTAGFVLAIAHSLHDRPYHDGRWAICVLVDWDCWRIHLTAHWRDRRGSSFGHCRRLSMHHARDHSLSGTEARQPPVRTCSRGAVSLKTTGCAPMRLGSELA